MVSSWLGERQPLWDPTVDATSGHFAV